MDSIENAIMRQQVYVEAVKNNEGEQLRPLMLEAGAILRNMLADLSVDRLGGLSRTGFNAFLIKLRKALMLKTKYSTRVTLQRLYNFLRADLKVSKYIFKLHLKKDPAFPNEDETLDDASQGGLFPVPLWARMNKEIVPAFGGTVENAYNGFYAGVIGSVVSMLSTAYADNTTSDSIMNTFTGSASLNYKDGLSNRLINQFTSLVSTAMQFVSNSVSSFIAERYFDNYRWISVLDSRTTEICQSRANKVYRYGEGPMPPAHYNCRSRIIPATATSWNEPDTFLDWVDTQSDDFQDFALGSRNAQLLRGGNLTNTAYPRFVNVNSMTIDEYSNAAQTING